MNFGYGLVHFLPRKLKISSETLNLLNQKSKTLSFSVQLLKGKCCGVALEVEG